MARKYPFPCSIYFNRIIWEKYNSALYFGIDKPAWRQGHAKTIYKIKILPILQAARANVTYFETKYHGHATEIARELDVNDYDIIVCCSGDGIPHEVINGFYLRPDKGLLTFNKIAVTQLPCGSGNALSLSTW